MTVGSSPKRGRCGLPEVRGRQEERPARRPQADDSGAQSGTRFCWVPGTTALVTASAENAPGSILRHERDHPGLVVPAAVGQFHGHQLFFASFLGPCSPYFLRMDSPSSLR